MQQTDVLIIGASAAGLMCAIEAGKRGRKVVVLDHSNKAGKKILLSGGGRCNFTNYTVTAENYISHNPHFCKSAISRYTQWDFIELVKKHHISFHERSHGQLFCDNSAKEILAMLLDECAQFGVSIHLNSKIKSVKNISPQEFNIHCDRENYSSQSLVIASGGLSFPSMGAGPFGYQLAAQFGINVWPTSAGLVPFTLHNKDKEKFSPLSGIAIDSVVASQTNSFRENILFTHRGLSGPAILQISSYWQPGQQIQIDLLPDLDLLKQLKLIKQKHPERKLQTVLSEFLPKRLLTTLLHKEMTESKMQSLTDQALQQIDADLHQWTVKPNATEGYRTAEVTLGGVDCNALSSKTMQCNKVPGLYFIGEVVDVSGWLGGYNFQWAWSSAWCAGQYV